MTIIELGALGEFLGAIGIVVTLYYLGLQTRQANKDVRINAKHHVISAYWYSEVRHIGVV